MYRLSEDDFYNAMINLFTEIKLLTGAVLYSPGVELNLQVQTLLVFIRSSPRFMALTVAEIRYAFHLNNQGELDETYKHYNRELNAEFIGGVLSSYVKKIRKPLDERSEEIRKMLGMIEAPAPVPKLDRFIIQHHIQTQYDIYRSGEKELCFISDAGYRYLRRIGAISFTDAKKWRAWYMYASEKHRQYLMQKLDLQIMGEAKRQDEKKAINVIFDAMKQPADVPNELRRPILTAMRRLVCFHLFDQLIAAQVQNIFSEIETK